MNKTVKSLLALLAVMFILSAVMLPAFAADETLISPAPAAAEEVQAEEETPAENNVKSVKAISAAAALAVVATAGAIAMAIAIKSSSDGIARQPEAAGNIRSGMMLGLVFIETVVIYALIVAILIIFVL
ncbi:MAG: ATP synthase F0 subunit C [Clostridia bacterium]|nr:ATP synthase F0 subunit C [Clostridia bacterium]